MKTGIDLGTTYSLISRVDKKGKSQLIPDHSDKDIFATPSTVYLDDNAAVVGHLVSVLLEENPDIPVIRFFKREFGNSKPIFFDNLGQEWYPEAIAALLLKKLRYDAENFMARALESTVITVPAHFNDLQRKAVINAANLADIPILGLVEEPVAAALHYGVSNANDEQLILVYDFGGGTFDATILSMDIKGVYVLAKDGLTELGGKEFDEVLGEYILNKFKDKYGQYPDLNAFTLLQLRRISEELKIEMSLPNKLTIKKKVLLADKVVDVLLTKKDFEKYIASHVEKTVEVLFRCVDGAGLKFTDINSILLVGGSSMIPYIRERLKKIIPNGAFQISFHEPMKAVAHGASLHALQISGEAEQYDIPPEFKGVTGYNVGIRTIDPRNGRVKIETLVKKNMPLPIKAKRVFYTSKQNQKYMNLEFVEFISSNEEVILIGNLRIGPLTYPKLNYPIEVTLEISEDSIVSIIAYDPSTGIELEQKFGQDQRDDGYLLRQRMQIKSVLINNY